MIASPCGGQTIKDRSSRSGVVLTWERCPCCGRCGRYLLKSERRGIARGEVARRAFGDPAVIEQIRKRK